MTMTPRSNSGLRLSAGAGASPSGCVTRDSTAQVGRRRQRLEHVFGQREVTARDGTANSQAPPGAAFSQQTLLEFLCIIHRRALLSINKGSRTCRRRLRRVISSSSWQNYAKHLAKAAAAHRATSSTRRGAVRHPIDGLIYHCTFVRDAARCAATGSGATARRT